jgi:two-component system sensor histidine kinase ChvG
MQGRNPLIEGAKAFLKRHWPSLRLRQILMAVLLFASAMPAMEAVGLRGYENTLVRQAQGELTAQGSALAAAASALWPRAQAPTAATEAHLAAGPRIESNTIDLNSTPVLPERPAGTLPRTPPDPDAVQDAGRMAPILAATTRSTLASVDMLDRSGQVVFGYGAGRSLADLVEVRSALGGKPATVLRRSGAYHPRYALEWLSRASALRLHLAQPITVDGRVTGVLLLSRSPRALFRGIYEDMGKLAAGALLIVGLLVILAGLVSRGVTRPIEALSLATRAVADGVGQIPQTPATAATEIRALYEDFRHMAAAIARRSRYLHDFAAAVSHEFKTPLAGICGAVEILQDHCETISPQERSRFLDNIAGDSARLSHLVGRLLDLARADMARPETKAMSDAVRLAERIADVWRDRGLEVEIEAGSVPAVAVAERAVEAVLTTLLENSRQGGAMQVMVYISSTDETVAMRVADNGCGVAPGDRGRLFEPFFTTRRADGGTGLGLAIARSLLETQGGSLSFVASPQGATFEIRLPTTWRPRGL